MKTLRESPFANTYGGLSLVERDDGARFLRMDDCFGPSFFGPLTAAHLAAFDLLAALPELDAGTAELSR
jgi:hypothetical protein